MRLPSLQIQFLHMMTSIFNRPPAVLKLPQRRGTFFAPLARRAGPPSLTIPKLFRRFVIALKAEPIGESRQLGHSVLPRRVPLHPICHATLDCLCSSYM